MAKQHVISEWLLKEFAAATPGGLLLTVLDKRTGCCSRIPPSRFMVEVDAHSDEVEKELSKHESRAKLSLVNLRTLMEKAPPGAYQLMRSDSHGQEFEFVSPTPTRYLEGMALIPSGVLNVADDRTFANLARYLAIIYTRSSRMRRYAALFHQGVDDSIRRELRRRRIPAPHDLNDIISPRDLAAMSPLRIMAQADGMLTSMTWWAIKTAPDDVMLLSDSPVVPTVALGHATERMHLGETSALVIAMPLTPRIAVVATRTPMLTLSGPLGEFGQLVNVCVWPWADRYVISSSEDHVRAVEARLDGPRDINDESPHKQGSDFGRRFARRRLIPSIRVKDGTATSRERHLIERWIGRKLPPNEVMAAAAKSQLSRPKAPGRHDARDSTP